MLLRTLIVAALLAGAPLAAAQRDDAKADQANVTSEAAMAPGERSGWALFLGVVVLAAALRRRRGPVVTS